MDPKVMQAQDIVKYFRIIKKWWWVIVLILVATVGTMAAIAYFTETEYEATVILQVSAPPPQETPLFSDFGRQALSAEIEQTRNSFNEFLQAGNAAAQTLELLPDVPMTRRELRDNITVELPKDSQLVHISVRARDPETAASLANTLVEVGLKSYGELLARPTANTRQFIERELEDARQALTDAETTLTQFQINNKVGNLNNAIDSQYALIRDLRKQSDLSRAEGDVAKAQMIEEAILEREAELQNMIGLSAQYTELVDQVARARDTHTFLLDRRAEAKIKESQILALGSIQVITPAQPPQNPVAVIGLKLILLGSVVSLLVGVLLAFFLEYLETASVPRESQQRLEPETVALPDSAG